MCIVEQVSIHWCMSNVVSESCVSADSFQMHKFPVHRKLGKGFIVSTHFRSLRSVTELISYRGRIQLPFLSSQQLEARGYSRLRSLLWPESFLPPDADCDYFKLHKKLAESSTNRTHQTEYQLQCLSLATGLLWPRGQFRPVSPLPLHVFAAGGPLSTYKRRDNYQG